MLTLDHLVTSNEGRMCPWMVYYIQECHSLREFTTRVSVLECMVPRGGCYACARN